MSWFSFKICRILICEICNDIDLGCVVYLEFGTFKSNKTINNYHITLEHITWSRIMDFRVIRFLSKNVQMLIVKNKNWTKKIVHFWTLEPPNTPNYCLLGHFLFF